MKDMFSIEKTDKPKRSKPAPPRKQSVAEVHGLISGLPQSFAKAQEALADIIRRCALAKSNTGVLTMAQSTRLAMIEEQLETFMPIIEDLRKTADGMIEVVIRGEKS